MSHWVYILHCSNNSLYTGYTTNVERRYQEHVQGTIKCKYTRSFKPLALAQCWQVSDKSTALMIESFIKKLSKVEKTQLIATPQKLVTLFPDAVCQLISQ